MVIALIICIPITAIVVGFLVLKSVSLGLKWQMQTKAGTEPELKTPVSTIQENISTAKANKQNQEHKALMDEWINGEART